MWTWQAGSRLLLLATYGATALQDITFTKFPFLFHSFGRLRKTYQVFLNPTEVVKNDFDCIAFRKLQSSGGNKRLQLERSEYSSRNLQ